MVYVPASLAKSAKPLPAVKAAPQPKPVQKAKPAQQAKPTPQPKPAPQPRPVAPPKPAPLAGNGNQHAPAATGKVVNQSLQPAKKPAQTFTAFLNGKGVPAKPTASAALGLPFGVPAKAAPKSNLYSIDGSTLYGSDQNNPRALSTLSKSDQSRVINLKGYANADVDKIISNQAKLNGTNFVDSLGKPIGVTQLNPALVPRVAAPQYVDDNVQIAGDQARKRASMAAGMGSTVLTSGLGVTNPANLASKTLLGA